MSNFILFNLSKRRSGWGSSYHGLGSLTAANIDFLKFRIKASSLSLKGSENFKCMPLVGSGKISNSSE